MEFIKVVGPAAIAAISAYYITRAQYKARISELDKKYNFSARRHLFDYYKSRLIKIEESQKKLNESLGVVLGVYAASKSANIDASDPIISGHLAIIEVVLKMMPHEIDSTRKDMYKKGLSACDEYEKLGSFANDLAILKIENSYENIKNIVIILLEGLYYLEVCNKILVEKQMILLLDEYTNT